MAVNGPPLFLADVSHPCRTDLVGWRQALRGRRPRIACLTCRVSSPVYGGKVNLTARFTIT
jgi:hypothetical protein